METEVANEMARHDMRDRLLSTFDLLDFLGEKDITNMLLNRAKAIGEKIKKYHPYEKL